MEHHMIARRISSIYLYDNGIESAIKVRKKNSTDQSNGSCYPRKLIVLQQMKNFKKWNGNTALAMDTDGLLLKLCFLPQRECLENTLWLGSVIQTWSRRCF